MSFQISCELSVASRLSQTGGQMFTVTASSFVLGDCSCLRHGCLEERLPELFVCCAV